MGRALLVCTVVILTTPRSSPARAPVPSPTPRPSSAGGTPTATRTPTGPCDAPIPVPQAAPNAVRSGELVTLDGGASSGDISSARWAQSGGPSVNLVDAESFAASFVAPPVAAPTAVTMTLVLFTPCTPHVVSATVDVMVLPPAGIASIAVNAANVVVGEPATIDVHLHTDQSVASLAHELTLGSALAVAATSDGQPQCAVSAELGAAAAQFAFTPSGCSGEDCTGIQVAIDAAEVIRDGALLYTCSVTAAGESPSSCGYPYHCCNHLLACSDPVAADADGSPVPAQCVEGVVGIEFPQPGIELVFTVDPPQPRVGDVVHIAIDTVRTNPGLVGLPLYSLRGTEPFLTGDVSLRGRSGPQVTYELQAVRAGTAELSVGVSFETETGCPGNEGYHRTGTGSEPYSLVIGPAACSGDCDADGRVAIDEMITGVRMALGDAALTACPAMDGDRSGAIQVDDLIAAVSVSLRGCASPELQHRE